ncbi:hypothetical protein EST38_g11214 [Candolleomyces aberdarensis]|uniref:Uncharacterized protein n=1 Tax=Candolleomyces aberdarensis TaxID=2316362 RepID=A0A4V1Q2C8_9AGAR|nr:hypothetical protein EST38_g11214 [Candolleomyces aberdarensis]
MCTNRRKRANDFINVTDRTIYKFLDKVDGLADSPEESKAWLKTLQKDPVIDSESRENRGLKHDLCGLLLCPIELDWDDEEVCNKVRNYKEGFELGPTARALYANFTGDPKNLDAGYLKSKLLLKLYKFIFTSPSSAKSVSLEESGDENAEPPSASKRCRTSQSSSRAPGKKDVATMLNMNNKVTPRSIAYAAVQLLFALSSAERWGAEHEGLDFYDTYYHVVDHFEGDHNNGSSKLLKWWDSQVFLQAKRSNTGGARRARKLIEEQRAARSRASQLPS